MAASRPRSGKDRPRLWVPGVVYVSDEREIQAGRHAGYNGWGKSFRLSGCAHFASIAEWRHRVWLVERVKLSPRIIDEHAIILAERLLDKDAQPHARRWLVEQPLVCVSGGKVERLAKSQGLRVYCVEHGVQEPSWFSVTATGGNRAGWEVSGPVEAFWPDRARRQAATEDSDESELPATERYDVRHAIDRVLRQLSGGKLTEAAVTNAFAVRKLLTPGYGYHGATDGTVATIGRVQRDLRALEALFAQIYERAESSVDQARELANAVDAAPRRNKEIAVPVYGRAHRLDLPELTIRLAEDGDRAGEARGLVARWLVNDEPRAKLVLPAEDRWVVHDVDLWNPELPAELAEELAKKDDSAGRRSSSPVTALLVLSLVALLAWLIYRLM
ncbi:MAG: hypothetical protein JRI68_19600 [Deltaproteobacteria bacterium]|nr:hypothetical protein [Deltaproteobacteria bacterium]